MDVQDELQVELQPITVSLGNLLLDPNNFRLAETLPRWEDEEFEELQENTLKKILDGYGVQDLESSILNHGWLDVDQIVVRKLRTSAKVDPPKFVVVEGNRRIAALINLVSDFKDRGITLPPSVATASKALRVMLIKGHEAEVDRVSEVIMGIRHIGGPRRWGGLQAAMMVVRLVDEDNFSMNEAGKRLGISSIEAKRRYRSYKAYEQAYKDGYRQPNLFTLLGEAIRVKSLREWLEWNDDDSCFKNKNSLNLFYEKLGLTEEGQNNNIKEEKLSNPQSVRDLRHIIENPNSRKVFEETHSLEKARHILSEHESTNRKTIVLLCEQLIDKLQDDEDFKNLSSQEKSRFLKLSNLIIERMEVVQ